MIWLKPQEMKSMNCISTTGSSPIIEAPMAQPIIADSLIGVSTIRSGPNLSRKPAVTRKAPP